MTNGAVHEPSAPSRDERTRRRSARLALAALHAVTNGDERVLRARDAALDHEEVLVRIDARYLQVEDADGLVAVLARHLDVRERTARRHVRTDRAAVAAVLVRSVRL